MARDGSGAHSLPGGNPVVTLTTIESVWANGTLVDISAELTNSLDRNGRGAMLAQFKAFDGTIAVPGVGWASEVSSGWYRAAAGDFRFAIGGIAIGGLKSTGLQQTDGAGNLHIAGFRDIPQVSQSAAYTTVLSDAGKHIYHPAADVTARIWTIPANATVPYRIGTAITFVNDTGAGVITIAITGDTLILAGPGTTGSRTLAANGTCTMLKIAATKWIITGTGLT